MRDILLLLMFVVLVVVTVSVVLVPTISHKPGRVPYKFKHGEMVTMKAFGHVGMVVAISCPTVKRGGSCGYKVRFSALKSSAQYHVLGSGGPIDTSPVSSVWVNEFELTRGEDNG